METTSRDATDRQRAGIYVRISSDQVGERKGVQRQLEDCHVKAVECGWDVIRVYEDNDVSAFSGKKREGYQALCTDICAGVLDAVVVWHPDRLHRSPVELEAFISLIERTGAVIVTCTAGDFDLATPEGRLVARITGSVARKESEDKSRRLKRYFIDASRRGVLHTGARKYGLVSDRSGTHVAAEVAVLRAIATRVLEGQSLRAICADLTTRGIERSGGCRWTPHKLQRTLLSPYVGGYRAHLGELVAQGTWQPLISEPVWRALRVELEKKDRVNHGSYGHLLSGIIECGSCGRRLASQIQKRSAHYMCRYGCAASAVRAMDAEAGVVALIWQHSRLTVMSNELVTARIIINRTVARLMTTPTRRNGPPNLDVRWNGWKPPLTLTIY